MLVADRIGKRFGPRWLFREVELDLKPGDRLIVTGRNGSGKSTLLRCLAGLERVTEGTVQASSIGLSALDGALYASLTAAEHLQLAADLRGIEARTDELLTLVDLLDARDVHARLLSSGMRARLRLALAIQPRPDVLLLDEPGASLDASGRELVARVCADQATRGVVIVATNDPQERQLGNLELPIA